MNREEQVSQVQLAVESESGLVTANAYPQGLEPIGRGRSAAVFRLRDEPDKAVKIFHPDFTDMAEQEITVYLKLGATKYYPQMYEYGTRYLVIDYVSGKTFYQCLIEGIFIPESAIKEVDAAIALAEEKGLRPSDIHLKNIMLTGQGVKLIDVARFLQNGDRRQWNDLKKAYYQKYIRPNFPKKIPEKVLEYIVDKYRKNELRI